jgi:hypothetical protein
LAALALAATIAGAAPSAAVSPRDARLQGIWTMSGRVTRAGGVRGEHTGQRVRREWDFTSTCASGPCTRVRLRRERSASRVDNLTLARVAPGVLAGRGRFYVALRCAGRVYRHGGIAYFRVRATVRRAQVVQGTRFATAIHATYDNWKRVNRTPCPGSLGRDAGVYDGRLSSPVPAVPAPDFSSAVESTTATASFTDLSSSPTGAAIVRWRWDFGDPASGADNTSTERNPSHRYGSGGSYTVSLTVTDSNGLEATVSRRIAVGAQPG